MKHLLSCLLLLVLSSTAYGIVLELDLSGGVVTYSNPNQTLIVNYTDIATGTEAPDIDLRLEAVTPYIANNAANGNNLNGSVNDDMKLHINSGSSTRFRLSLLNGGTETLYDPGVDFSFNFVIYDIDGNVAADRGADQITFYTDLTYTATASSTVAVSSTSESITFTGTAGSVVGQAGLTDFADADQENASIEFTVQNQNQFDFDFAAPNNGAVSEGRNMLLDANDLTVNGTPIDFVVPEPSNYALWTGVCATLLILRRKRVQ